MTKDPDFKGYISDVGGPTAEFRAPACRAQLKRGACVYRQCLFPKPCPNLEADHSDYRALLRELRQLPQLRVAPEHISDPVLREMGKPDVATYNAFVKEFEKVNEQLLREGKIRNSQYVVPYLMSSHPGSRLSDAIALAEYLHRHHLDPDQVQDFYPTPGTISTCMYYTGLDPRTMKPVYVARDPHTREGGAPAGGERGSHRIRAGLPHPAAEDAGTLEREEMEKGCGATPQISKYICVP